MQTETYYTLQLSDAADVWTHSDRWGRPYKFTALEDAVAEAEVYLNAPQSSMERATIFKTIKSNELTLHNSTID